MCACINGIGTGITGLWNDCTSRIEGRTVKTIGNCVALVAVTGGVIAISTIALSKLRRCLTDWNLRGADPKVWDSLKPAQQEFFRNVAHGKFHIWPNMALFTKAELARVDPIYKMARLLADLNV